MRVLCICSRGNVRSVNMAYLLKDHCNTEAIAIGFNATNCEARWFLMGWADKIIVLDAAVWEEMGRSVYEPHRRKFLFYDVPLSQSGLDAAYKPDQLAAYEKFLADNGLMPAARRAVWRTT